ncbi:hypothetical protein DDZ13_06820 [Coraliomargarita sinensis]|uniref:STAS/SEC14 domain-containing protein n=1 Tax=Coraliomargarita sinensis TaxID=2174842 RepID=A0A317ZFJ1_9BACT|nr:hypothetical protein [Coraliomargarita sinensis]PXA04246.1 hypothetical protein DDZ13_06820 [Coraliomargarita sinensis]
MNYEIKFYPQYSLVVERIEGEITLDSLQKKTQSLLSDPDFKDCLSGAIDLRNAHTQMSKPELQSYAQLMDESEAFKTTKWAIIGNDPMVIALSQVFQQQMSDSELIGVFGSVAKAAQFLSKPELLHFLND